MNKRILCTVILTLYLPLSSCSSDTRTQPVSTSAPPDTAATNTKPIEQTPTQTPTPTDEKPEIIFDVHSIVNKNLYQVEQVIGEHETEEEGDWLYDLEKEQLPYVLCTFAKGKYEVMFHEAKAATVRINLPDKKYKFPNDAEKAMRAVGLTGLYDFSTGANSVTASKVNDFYSAEAGKWADYKEPYIQFVRVVVDERFN
ncbi:hypothetical protein [Aneurinibacillus aneurinilyticus]|jgi:hypothetical protein|uniref:hypothetical protein n=1 Tax=Aneurinibacillus aneurinilyticus TaxID=1391 RepID=UPI0023F17DED|nr:hypothetical protein [Aneurinibacillus aneurinilyticus]